MGEIEKDSEIYWTVENANKHKLPLRLYWTRGAAEEAYGTSKIECVRVTPEPERFYVDIDTCHPIEVKDRKSRHIAVARFWNPLGDRASILERAKIHADWLNGEDKKDDGHD